MRREWTGEMALDGQADAEGGQYKSRFRNMEDSSSLIGEQAYGSVSIKYGARFAVILLEAIV
jgi:hypothetical protein